LLTLKCEEIAREKCKLAAKTVNGPVMCEELPFGSVLWLHSTCLAAQV
jgi:hypothetical protein